MLNNPIDFLTWIKYIVCGKNGNAGDNLNTVGSNSVFTPTVFPTPGASDGGFILDVPLALSAFIANTASGAVLTTPSAATGGLYIALGVNSSATNSGYISWTVPRDYDEASDQFTLRVLVNQAAQVTDKSVQLVGQLTITTVQPNASPSTLTTSGAIYATVPFSSNAGTTTAANGAKITSVSPNVQVLELQFNGNGLKRDDAVTIFLRPAGSSTPIRRRSVLRFRPHLRFLSRVVQSDRWHRQLHGQRQPRRQHGSGCCACPQLVWQQPAIVDSTIKDDLGSRPGRTARMPNSAGLILLPQNLTCPPSRPPPRRLFR